MNEIEEYISIAKKITDFLNNLEFTQTKDTTRNVKMFFKNYYLDKKVTYSDKNEGLNEYLWDVTVFNSKKDIFERYSMDEKQSIYCIVESELGGVSAASPNLIQKNLRYDFQKLLCGKSRLKIFIGAYSISESQTIVEKVEDLHLLYKAYDEQCPILLILIQGYHNKRNNQSSQILIDHTKVDSFILEPDKYSPINLA